MIIIQGRRTEAEDAGVIIRRVARFMEACLDKWLKYISDQRNTNLHLNYFTIDQLVELQREIVKVGTHYQPNSLIYPLLSAVKTNCSPKDLTEAVTESQEQIDVVNKANVQTLLTSRSRLFEVKCKQ